MSYATMALIFLAGAAVVAVLCLLPAWPPSVRWRAVVGLVALALAVLTAVFDSVMIAADLFRYDESMLSGARVLLAPVEDFAWPLAAAVLLPSLWVRLGRRRSRARQVGGAGAAGSAKPQGAGGAGAGGPR
ncbi:lycopene cyclase domain-containing protein [Georgenia soli]|uniref:Lycopene cyclase domain-containing protein n=1 Tax=Georgenia soli TaxID=638953 RepID=A0A2A9EKQ8_9MICO|nr:lycopene cyclase domain-containing protein [Georgenia soli]PFG39121.1 lycopene cyclase domain-containing protein [Georgenia soli]